MDAAEDSVACAVATFGVQQNRLRRYQSLQSTADAEGALALCSNRTHSSKATGDQQHKGQRGRRCDGLRKVSSMISFKT